MLLAEYNRILVRKFVLLMLYRRILQKTMDMVNWLSMFVEEMTGHLRER